MTSPNPQELHQLAALCASKHHVPPAPLKASQIIVHNDRDRHPQLAEQSMRLALHPLPVDGPVALFFREDMTEPNLQLVSIHVRDMQRNRRAVSNVG